MFMFTFINMIIITTISIIISTNYHLTGERTVAHADVKNNNDGDDHGHEDHHHHRHHNHHHQHLTGERTIAHAEDQMVETDERRWSVQCKIIIDHHHHMKYKY